MSGIALSHWRMANTPLCKTLRHLYAFSSTCLYVPAELKKKPIDTFGRSFSLCGGNHVLVKRTSKICKPHPSTPEFSEPEIAEVRFSDAEGGSYGSFPKVENIFKRSSSIPRFLEVSSFSLHVQKTTQSCLLWRSSPYLISHQQDTTSFTCKHAV